MAAHVESPSFPTGPQLDNRRIAAAVIDLVVPLALGAVALAAGLSLTRGLALVALGWTLYYFFALESGDGQTLGKRLMRLRVVSADGSPASMGQIAKRTVVRVLDGHIVGLIVMLATGERRQRLGDIVAGTVVTEADVATEPSPSSQRPEVAAEPPTPATTEGEPRDASPRMGLLPRSLPTIARLLERRRARQDVRAQAHDPTPAPMPTGRLEERLRPAPLPELKPFDPLGEPVVEVEDPGAVAPVYDAEPDLDGPAPVVEIDAPMVEADGFGPAVELDPPEPAIDFEVPAVELDQPEPATDFEVPAPEPSPPIPRAEEEPDTEMTVKPIETVSAIDLVMQDAEEPERR